MPSNFSVYYEFILRDRFSKVAKRIDAHTKSISNRISVASYRMKTLGKSMVRVGRNMSLFVSAPIIVGFTMMAKKAIDAEETFSKFAVVFKDVGKKSEAVAKELQYGYGLSSVAAKKLLSDTGDLLSGFGFQGAAALDLSTKVNKLAVDLASFTNIEGGADRASAALTKALLGERESVKLLGIAILEEDVKKQMSLERTKGLRFENKRIAKAYATYSLMVKQSKNAIGDFNRTQGQTANQLRISKARFDDIQVSLGKYLIPYVLKLTEKFNQLAKAFENKSPAFKKNLLLFLGIAAVVAPLIMAIGFLSQGIGVLTSVVGFLMTKALIPLFTLMFTNPIGLIITGIAALVVGIILMIKYWDKVKIVLLKVWNFFIKFGKFTPLAPFIIAGELIYKNWSKIKDLFSIIGSKISAFVSKFRPMISLISKIPFFGDNAPDLKTPTGSMDKVLAKKAKGEKSTFEGNLNINGLPKGSILQTVSSGNMNMNVGMNMEGAY